MGSSRPYVVHVLNPAPGERRTYSYATAEKRDEMAEFLRRGGYQVQVWDNLRGGMDA